ncbi:hypothetical protein EDB19DRAFT_1002629 [Suillus lakei]|nr:hypothetical protein EDB19DRAFT_1002629 [Suillus lakei]
MVGAGARAYSASMPPGINCVISTALSATPAKLPNSIKGASHASLTLPSSCSMSLPFPSSSSLLYPLSLYLLCAAFFLPASLVCFPCLTSLVCLPGIVVSPPGCLLLPPLCIHLASYSCPPSCCARCPTTSCLSADLVYSPCCMSSRLLAASCSLPSSLAHLQAHILP